MTEAEWLAANNPEAMLTYARPSMSLRKARLYVSACSRENWRRKSFPTIRRIEELEQAADAEILVPVIPDAPDDDSEWAVLGGSDNLLDAIAWILETDSFGAGWPRMMLSRLLLWDIFGNPFRPVTFSPEWRTSTVLALAQQMYDTRDFSAMPILADALQDANCADEAILTHCRGPGPHVRGCHVVDALLNKS